jgi:hypothetical protein
MSGLRGCGDRVRAGQAARVGEPQAASKRLIHSVSRCQPWGKVQGDLAAAVAGDPAGDFDLVAAGVAPHPLPRMSTPTAPMFA